MKGNRGFTAVELLVVLVGLMILGAIGFFAYDKIIGKSKVYTLQQHLKQYGDAIYVMYQDTGALAGLDPNVPFPDSLISPNSIADATVAQKWKGPYIQTIPSCPYNGCQYGVDYTTGQANNVGDTYLYFVTATNVPLADALELARKLDGDNRIAAGECLEADIPNAVANTSNPCKVYLSANSGGAGTTVTVYYTFYTGRM